MQCVFSICGCISVPVILLEDLCIFLSAQLVYNNYHFKINPSAAFG